MCGIAGIFGNWPSVDLSRFRDDAFAYLATRGPDQRGAVYWRDATITDCTLGPIRSPISALLVHTRLSVMDLTDAGRQPMLHPDGKAVLVYNGEIYNFEELRARLSTNSSRLRSTGDTE